MDLATLSPGDLTLYGVMNIGVMISIVLVVMMQPGFLLLEVGSVSRRNALNDAFKNALDLCVGGLAFWLVGYDIASGEGPLMEQLRLLGLVGEAPPPERSIGPVATLGLVFQLAFAVTGATICSGAVTGRIWSLTYLVFVVIFAGVIYPLAAFAVWNPAGPMNGVFHDFAGGVVVHSVGAAAGLAGTLLLRPRMGYNGYDPLQLGRERLFRVAARHAPHNVPMAALGVFLLWIGWYGFNGGTLLAAAIPVGPDDGPIEGARRLGDVMTSLGDVIIATTLAPCAAAVTLTALRILMREDLRLLETMNAMIAGLVGVTAGADIVSPAGAVGIGVGSALVYRATRQLLVRLSVDDPVSAIAAHGFTGVFGAAAAGFAMEGDAPIHFATQGGIGLGLMAATFFAALIAFKIAEWLSILGVALTRRARLSYVRAHGMLRISPRIEIAGIDQELHGQDAYSFQAKDV